MPTFFWRCTTIGEYESGLDELKKVPDWFMNDPHTFDPQYWSQPQVSYNGTLTQAVFLSSCPSCTEIFYSNYLFRPNVIIGSAMH